HVHYLCLSVCSSMHRHPPSSTLFPYTTLFRSRGHLLLTSVSYYRPNAYQAFVAWLDPAESVVPERDLLAPGQSQTQEFQQALSQDRKSTRLNSSHVSISYAVFCLKKKKKQTKIFVTRKKNKDKIHTQILITNMLVYFNAFTSWK